MIQEKLSRPGRPVKVHNFRGATLDDMKYHVIPIIRKEPSFAILHIGTNDAPHTTSKEILDQILELKALIIKELPTCRVVISTPTVRSDNAKAALTVSQLTNKLLELNIETVDNRNINHRNLGQKGLHLNQSGTSRFAKNIFSIIKGFRIIKGCPGISNIREPDHPLLRCEHPSELSENRIDESYSSDLNSLKKVRQKNIQRPIIGQLNINSVRNKFSFLCSEISQNLDILLLSETKLDSSLPTGQFLMNGFRKPYRLDQCSNGGGLLLFIREDLPSRELTEYKIPDKTECVFVEINIRKKKWLLCCLYNPHKNNISNHMHHLNKGLDVYLKNYDNLIILGDLNSELEETCLNDFCNVNNLKSLNKKPTCFKNPENPSCIDLFLTNRQKSFQNTSTFETGISDFHKLVVTVLKMYYKKQKPKMFQYRNYKTFNEESFKNELNRELTLIDLNNAELADFQDIYLSVLNKHAPVKHKYIRANNSNFMTKNLRKEIMLRSKFRNVYLKTITNESKQLYNKQRNLCVTLFRKAKNDYFSTLDNRIVSDNRKFWKAVNPLFSEKTFQEESITLIDKETDEIISKNEKIAESFNSFYSTMVENLKIDPLIDISNVSTHPDPILRAIETYKNHSSILKIKAF